jgi:ParB family chromosome partitioning protein
MGKQALPYPRKGNLFSIPPEDVTVIGLDTTDGPEHPLYDDRIHLPIDMNLVKNIMVKGVIQPVQAVKDGDRILIVEGRQRVRAARKANQILRKEGKEPVALKVEPVKGENPDLFGIMVSANEHRKDDTPMAKARKLARFLAMGKTEQEAAVLFGVTVRSIKDWQLLLDLDPKVQQAVDGGQIAATACKELAKLPRKEQKAALSQLLETAEPGKRVTQRAAERGTGKVTAKSKAPSKKEIKRLLALDEDVLYNGGLDDHAIKVLRWAIGDLQASSISGLSGLLTKSEQESKKSKPKPKAAKAAKKGNKKKAPRRPPKKKNSGNAKKGKKKRAKKK